MKPKYKIYAAIILLIYIVIIWPILQKHNLANTDVNIPMEDTSLSDDSTYPSQSSENELSSNESITAENEKIVVDLRGAVTNPGVYHLDEGARMFELIKIAGGFDNANESCVNNAQIIADESQIIIPEKNNDCSNESSPSLGTTSSSTTTITSQKVNINTANESTLATLPGIGATRAQDIVEYRNQNGKFSKTADLKNVKGIGEQTFSNIQDLISV